MATAICPIQVETGPSKTLRRRKADRRSNQRFELALEFDLYLLRGAKGVVWCAAGTTLDWSRNSILLRCGRNLAEGSSVQLVVRWTAGVQLVVTGRVIRSDERGMVFKIQRRRFRGKPLLIVTLEQLINWQPTGRPN